MIEKNVNLELAYELDNLHHVVVQAADVGAKYVYALQLLHGQTDIIVYRNAPDGKHVVYNENNPVLYLTGKAGGHTQTWKYSGESGCWLVGTKPKPHGSIAWTTQIARVRLDGSGQLGYRPHNGGQVETGERLALWTGTAGDTNTNSGALSYTGPAIYPAVFGYRGSSYSLRCLTQ